MPLHQGNEILPLSLSPSLHAEWMKVIRERNEHESIFNGTLIKYIYFFLPHNFLRLKRRFSENFPEADGALL